MVAKVVEDEQTTGSSLKTPASARRNPGARQMSLRAWIGTADGSYPGDHFQHAGEVLWKR